MSYLWAEGADDERAAAGGVSADPSGPGEEGVSLLRPKWLCWFRHRWTFDWDKRICLRCERVEEAIYDMAYGGTIWREVS
jgi:hypothetical protein